MGDTDTSVKVAVRVRPFNQREIERGCKLCIKMNGNTTWITDSDGTEKSFAFDHSYWSYNREDDHYADQMTVFEDLGTDVLANSWDGYNCSIFAYGQTGSGKSYSMLGYGEDVGIIPRICERLFEQIKDAKNQNEAFRYQVHVSFMEIYNEKVKDLLNPNNKGILKVRNHPTIGPYVEDLSKVAVNSYAEIDALMDEGTKARTVASTNMNATSSRSHAVFTIEFTHAEEGEEKSGKTSRVNLVDLAGSERAASTGNTGVRLKEGANINKSLSTLAKVISSLAILSSGTSKKPPHVPYRDSVLTWLLKESLGGNAKTIMIAALSPADINYGETLSTLRYADNAKKIKNKAVVNEDAQVRMIRDLKSEIEALRIALIERGGDPENVPGTKGSPRAKGKGTPSGAPLPPAQLKLLEEELSQREKLIGELNKSWEERLKEAQEMQLTRKAALEDMGVAIQAVTTLPHLVNLNEDPLMSESLLYYLKEGTTKVGRPDAPTPQDILLNGLSIAQEHCTITHKEGVVELHPLPGAAVFVNGERVTESQRLSQGNRVVLGNNHVFRFNHPEEARVAREREGGERGGKREIIDWDFAIKELAAAQYASGTSGKNKEAMEQFVRNLFPSSRESSEARKPLPTDSVELARLVFSTWRAKIHRRKVKKQIREVVLLIPEANALAQALHQPLSFELKLWTSFPSFDPNASKEKSTQVGVKLTHTVTKATAVWKYDIFLDKVAELRELHQTFLQSGVVESPSENFFADAGQSVGVAHVYLKPLSHLFSISRKLPILNHAGEPTGELSVEIVPTVPEGVERTNDEEELDRASLMGKSLIVSISVLEDGSSTPSHLSNLHCRCSFGPGEEWGLPGEAGEDIPFGEKRKFTIDRITEELLSFLEQGAVSFEVLGDPTTAPEEEEVAPPPERKEVDVQGSVDILELEKGHFLSVPIKEDFRPQSKEDPGEASLVFIVRKGKRRRISLNVLEALGIKCLGVSVSQVRLKTNAPQSSQTPFSPQSYTSRGGSSTNLLSLKEESSVELKLVVDNGSQIVATWDPRDHPSPLMHEKTLKGYRVSMNITWDLQLPNISKAVHVTIPILFKVVDGATEFKESNSLLEQFRGLLPPSGDGKKKEMSGSVFSLKINQNDDVSEPSTIVAMLDEHQQQLAKLEHALELEKLRQELEFQQKLSPIKKMNTEDTTKELEEQIVFLQKAEEASKTRRRSTSLSAVKSVAVEMLSSYHRNVQMSGYLNKKSSLKNRWKKFWFILSRPTLYYYESNALQREKIIDLSDCALTPVTDPENPFAFAIVTWKRVWVLQASNREEQEAWMSAIDPALTTFELQHRVAAAQEELAAKETEIHLLTSRLTETDGELKQKVTTLQSFCSSLTKKLELLKGQLMRERDEGKRKDSEIALLRQLNESLQKNEQDKVETITKQLEALHPILKSKESEAAENAQKAERLAADLSLTHSALQSQTEVMELLEESQEYNEGAMRRQAEMLETLTSQSHSDANQLHRLQEQVTVLEGELIEKDYQMELLTEKVKSLEEELKSQVTTNDQMNAKLKLKKEELSSKDNLLSDKFTVKIPTDESSFSQKLFGPSRADFLEKQLIASKKASLAHQTHNAFLNMEITRYEKEMKLQLKLREQTIDRLKKEVSVLRKRLFQVSKEKGERMSLNNGQEGEDTREHLNVLKKKYFANYVVVTKMNLATLGRTCNINGNQLWEQAQAEGVEFEEYGDWINSKMNKAAVAVPDYE